MAKNFFADDDKKPDAPAPSAQAAAPNAAPAGTTPTANGNFFRDPPPDAAASSAKPTYGADEGWGQYAGDIAYRAANTGSLGALDYANAAGHWATGDGFSDSLAKIHKENDEWQANHPYAAVGADVAGYGLGLGKVGIGAKIGARLGEGLLARMGGAALEGAGTGVIADEAHSAGQASVGDLLKTAAISGTVGGITGAIPGEKGALAGGESPKPILDAVKDSAYKPLESTHYDPSAIANDFDALKSGLSAKQSSGMGEALDTQIDKISRSIADKQKAGQSVTADDVANFQNQLKGAAKSDVDIRIAQQFTDGLSDTLKTTKPLYTPLSGPAEIAAQAKSANAAALKANTNNDIEGWMKQAQGGDTAETQSAIRKKLDDSPNFFPTVGDQLAAASQKPGLVSQIAMKAAHPVGDALVSGGAEYMFGGHDIGSALAAGAAGAAGGVVLSHSLSQARTNDLVARLAQARHINANGSAPPLSAFKPGVPVLGPLGAYARRGAPALGASGAFMDYGRPN